MILNQAKNIIVGSRQVQAVKLGTQTIWENGPTENLFDGVYYEQLAVSCGLNADNSLKAAIVDGRGQSPTEWTKGRISIQMQLEADTVYTIKTWDYHVNAYLLLSPTQPVKNVYYNTIYLIGTNVDFRPGVTIDSEGPIPGYTFNTGSNPWITLYLSNNYECPRITITKGDRIPDKYIPYPGETT